jgi:hypothetical protein
MGLCVIEGCGKIVLACGLCSAHYAKRRKYGDPLAVKQKQLHGVTLAERFWANVKKCDGDGCWEWVGYRDPGGYGRLNIKLKSILAHRVSWELSKGKITSSEHVLHRCDNPPCVRPSHLFLGDQILNNADMKAKGRDRKRGLTGEDHARAKLDWERVSEIRAAAGSETISALSKRYGVSRANIRDIINRKIWRPIEGAQE